MSAKIKIIVIGIMVGVVLSVMTGCEKDSSNGTDDYGVRSIGSGILDKGNCQDISPNTSCISAYFAKQNIRFLEADPNDLGAPKESGIVANFSRIEDFGKDWKRLILGHYFSLDAQDLKPNILSSVFDFPNEFDVNIQGPENFQGNSLFKDNFRIFGIGPGRYSFAMRKSEHYSITDQGILKNVCFVIDYFRNDIDINDQHRHYEIVGMSDFLFQVRLGADCSQIAESRDHEISAQNPSENSKNSAQNQPQQHNQTHDTLQKMPDPKQIKSPNPPSEVQNPIKGILSLKLSSSRLEVCNLNSLKFVPTSQGLFSGKIIGQNPHKLVLQNLSIRSGVYALENSSWSIDALDDACTHPDFSPHYYFAKQESQQFVAGWSCQGYGQESYWSAKMSIMTDALPHNTYEGRTLSASPYVRNSSGTPTNHDSDRIIIAPNFASEWFDTTAFYDQTYFNDLYRLHYVRDSFSASNNDQSKFCDIGGDLSQAGFYIESPSSWLMYDGRVLKFFDFDSCSITKEIKVRDISGYFYSNPPHLYLLGHDLVAVGTLGDTMMVEVLDRKSWSIRAMGQWPTSKISAGIPEAIPLLTGGQGATLLLATPGPANCFSLKTIEIPQ